MLTFVLAQVPNCSSLRVPFIDVWRCLSCFQQSPGPQTLHSLLSSWSFFAFFITWSCSLGNYFLVTLFFHWRFYHWSIYSQDVTSKCNLFLPLPAPLTFYQKFVLFFLGSVGCWTFPSRWLKAAQGHLIQYCISFFFLSQFLYSVSLRDAQCISFFSNAVMKHHDKGNL